MIFILHEMHDTINNYSYDVKKLTRFEKKPLIREGDQLIAYQKSWMPAPTTDQMWHWKPHENTFLWYRKTLSGNKYLWCCPDDLEVLFKELCCGEVVACP